MTNDATQAQLYAQLFRELLPLLRKAQIEFFLVGATARDLHLSNTGAPLRATRDVDLAVTMIDEAHFEELKQALVQSGFFKAHPTEPIRLISSCSSCSLTMTAQTAQKTWLISSRLSPFISG